MSSAEGLHFSAFHYFMCTCVFPIHTLYTTVLIFTFAPIYTSVLSLIYSDTKNMATPSNDQEITIYAAYLMLNLGESQNNINSKIILTLFCQLTALTICI